MSERFTPVAAFQYVAKLLIEKGARIKLKQRGEERGIAGTTPEIYAVDKDVILTAEELLRVREHVVEDIRTGLRITKAGLHFNFYVAFIHDPDLFEDDDPVYPERGSFEQIVPLK